MAGQTMKQSLLAIIIALFLTAAGFADESLRIFKLEHAEAEEMAEIIDRLSDGNATLAIDRRTNSIIMVGPEDSANVIENLLQRLDYEVENEHEHDDHDAHREHDDEEHGHHEEEEEIERAEAREQETLERREIANHAESLEREIQFMREQIEAKKAGLEYRSRLMRLDLEMTKTMLEFHEQQIVIARKNQEKGLIPSKEVSAVQLQQKKLGYEIRKKEMELQFFVDHEAPMRIRELEFNTENKQRELEHIQRHHGDERHERLEDEHEQRRQAEQRQDRDARPRRDNDQRGEAGRREAGPRAAERRAAERNRDQRRREASRREAEERERNERQRIREQDRRAEENERRGDRNRDRDQRRDSQVQRAKNVQDKDSPPTTETTSVAKVEPKSPPAPTLFSGPQVGEKILPFNAKVVFGDNAGETRRLLEADKDRPHLLVFVHKVTRPSIGLSRMLVDYTQKQHAEKLITNVVFLTADQTETEAWMKRARHALPHGVTPLVSVDGAEGPGAYGLNRNATVTALVTNQGKVVGNFALVQPSISADAPRIGQAIVQATGGQGTPTLDQMGFAGRRMTGRRSTNPEQDRVYRAMMAPLIQKTATPSEVLQAAAAIEEYAAKHDWFNEKVKKAATMIVNGGKLTNYGTPEAQEYLKSWAK